MAFDKADGQAWTTGISLGLRQLPVCSDDGGWRCKKFLSHDLGTATAPWVVAAVFSW